MNKVFIKGAISLFVATVLLLSMATIVAAFDSDQLPDNVREWFESKGVDLNNSITWDLDSVSGVAGYEMHKQEFSESGSVSLSEEGDAWWVAKEAAAHDLTFLAATWYGAIEFTDGSIEDAAIGVWDSGFTVSGQMSVSGDSMVWNNTFYFVIDVGAFPVLKDQYLAFTLYGSMDTVIITDGVSSVTYPEDRPAYPVPELPTILLFGVGLAGLGTWFGLRRRKERTSYS